MTARSQKAEHGQRYRRPRYALFNWFCSANPALVFDQKTCDYHIDKKMPVDVTLCLQELLHADDNLDGYLQEEEYRRFVDQVLVPDLMSSPSSTTTSVQRIFDATNCHYQETNLIGAAFTSFQERYRDANSINRDGALRGISMRDFGQTASFCSLVVVAMEAECRIETGPVSSPSSNSNPGYSTPRPSVEPTLGPTVATEGAPKGMKTTAVQWPLLFIVIGLMACVLVAGLFMWVKGRRRHKRYSWEGRSNRGTRAEPKTRSPCDAVTAAVTDARLNGAQKLAVTENSPRSDSTVAGSVPLHLLPPSLLPVLSHDDTEECEEGRHTEDRIDESSSPLLKDHDRSQDGYDEHIIAPNPVSDVAPFYGGVYYGDGEDSRGQSETNAGRVPANSLASTSACSGHGEQDMIVFSRDDPTKGHGSLQSEKARLPWECESVLSNGDSHEYEGVNYSDDYDDGQILLTESSSTGASTDLSGQEHLLVNCGGLMTVSEAEEEDED